MQHQYTPLHHQPPQLQERSKRALAGQRDGEATALLLSQQLKPLGVSVSRIASGVPHGGDLEYADPVTIGRAIAGRRDIE